MPDQFQEWEAAELYCPKCKAARPVHKRLLLILPDGDKYEYTCAQCGTSVGGKMDQKPGNLRILIK